MPVVPLLAIVACGYLMASLPGVTWLRFGVWLLIGLAIYACYGRRHSRLAAALRAPAQVTRLPRAIRILPERTRSVSSNGRSSPMKASSFSLEPCACSISESLP